MKEKFKEFINYVEEHLYAFVLLLAGFRVLAYFIEVIRRCIKK